MATNNRHEVCCFTGIAREEMIKYIIKQVMKDINQSFRRDIYETTIERVAIYSINEMREEYPDYDFELWKITEELQGMING